MKKTYRLKNLDCANCAAKMEHAISKVAGVEQASVSFMTQRLTIEVTQADRLEEIMQTVQAVCRKVEPDCTILL